MKILHIADISGIGGLQTAVRGLAIAQIKRGHEVHIMVPPWVKDTAQKERFIELPLHHWNPNTILEFDIVHTHGTFGFFNPKWRKFRNRPAIVHTYHGTILGIQIAMKWYQNLIGWNGLSVPKGIWMEIMGGWGADLVIAVSPKVKREVRRFYRIIEQKTTVIPNGYISLRCNLSKRELRQLLGLPETDFLWLFVGRSDPVKAFDMVLSAFRRIRAQNQHCRLIVAPRERSFSNNDQIIGLSLPLEKMPFLYQACDAFVNVSIYEAYSIAVHEALAYGLPAIISKGAGNSDYCTHGVDSLLVCPRPCFSCENALIEFMCWLMKSPEVREHLSLNAKLKFAPRTWDWVAQQVDLIYAKALEIRREDK
jgi:glycosyltransferase involved in cell wall biosynthesis